MLRLLLVILTSLALSGCGKHLDSEPARQPDTQSVGHSLFTIVTHSNAIDTLAAPTVPAVKEHTAIIRSETDHLAVENEKAKQANKLIANQAKEIDSLNAAGRTFVNWAIGGAVALGILAMAVGFWQGSKSLIAVGVGAIVGAAVAKWVFTWAWVIAPVVVVGALLWWLLVQRKAIAEVVTTTEVAKRLVAAGHKGGDVVATVFTSPDAQANQIQSKSTQTIVARVRSRFTKPQPVTTAPPATPVRPPSPLTPPYETGGGAA